MADHSPKDLTNIPESIEPFAAPSIHTPVNGSNFAKHFYWVEGYSSNPGTHSVEVCELDNGQVRVWGEAPAPSVSWKVLVYSKYGTRTIFARVKGGFERSNLVTITNTPPPPPDPELPPPPTPPLPVIKEPESGFTSTAPVTFSGTGVTGNLLVLLQGLGDTVLGATQIADKIWSLPLSLAPGVHSIVAVQWNIFMQVSKRTSRVAVYVLPPALEVEAAQVSPDIFRLSGTRSDDATLYVTDGAAPGGEDWVVTSEGKNWQADAVNWKPGNYRVQVHQCVRGGVDDLCSLPTDKDITIEVPTPSLDKPGQVDQVPSFAGKGNVWPGIQTTIRVYINGELHPDVPGGIVQSDRSWSITALRAFAPDEYLVTAEQHYNGLKSEPTAAQKLVIERQRPAPPEIDPVNDGGRFPTISGKGISGGTLKLIYSDVGTEHSIEIRNGRWSFQRTDKALTPGRHSVTARQEVDGLASDSVTQAFVVDTPQPQITRPIQDAQVGADTDVEGSGAVAGAVMEIYDYISEELLNSAPMTDEHEVKGWQVTLRNLPFGRRHIFAVQTYEGQPSKPSDFRSFNVILLPPGITYPKSNDDVPRSSIHRGTGTPFALIELRLKGASPDEQVEYVYADENGEWQKELKLPLGPCTVRARQSIDDQESEFSEPVPFIVVPDEPRLETPTNLEPVESLCVVSGFADSPGTVTLALAKESPPLETVVVNDNGTWSLRVHLEDIPAGEHSLIARLSQEGFDSHWSRPRSFVLRKNPPAMDMPRQGDWANNRVAFAGKANPKAIIEMHPWFNPDIGLTPERVSADTSGNWNTEAEKDLVQGPNWATARQRTVDEGGQEQVSEAAISGRFEVVSDDSESVADGVND